MVLLIITNPQRNGWNLFWFGVAVLLHGFLRAGLWISCRFDSGPSGIQLNNNARHLRCNSFENYFWFGIYPPDIPGTKKKVSQLQ